MKAAPVMKRGLRAEKVPETQKNQPDVHHWTIRGTMGDSFLDVCSLDAEEVAVACS